MSLWWSTAWIRFLMPVRSETRGSPARERTDLPRPLVGLPYPREIVAPQKLSEHVGVHLVCLDLRMRDGLRSKRIRDHDLVDERLQDSDHAPRVRGRLHRHLVFGLELFAAKLSQRFTGAGEALTAHHRTRLVQDAGFHHPLVDIQPHELH